MMSLKCIILAFLTCRTLAALAAGTAPAALYGVARSSGVPAFAHSPGYPRDGNGSRSSIFRRRKSSGKRSLAGPQRRPSLVAVSTSTSTSTGSTSGASSSGSSPSGHASRNNVAPASGLTTSSTVTQNGGGGRTRRGRERGIHPETDIFFPIPGSAVSLINREGWKASCNLRWGVVVEGAGAGQIV